MFIGREKELDELNHLYKQNSFQMFVLYGRRRVGKTTLLKEFCKDKKSIFYSAEQTNDKLNLEKISRLIFSYYGESALEPFTSWENVFLYVHARQSDEPLVFVLDEFPYLAELNKALLSVMQHLIDHTLKEGKLFLVICGSYMGFMEKEVLGAKSPLFGRRSGQLHMRPFDYRTAVRFMGEYPAVEKLKLYGAYGGTPMYLQQIQKEKSVKENLSDSFLKRTGYLYEEPLLLLRQEVSEPGMYSAIIEAIAGGASKANEIAMKTGEPAAKCLKYIATLCELGILYKEIPFGEKHSSRKTIYAISDPMFRFWYRYVAPNRTLLETDAREIVWKRRIEPDYSHYMGKVFEQICKEYLLQKNSREELPVLFTEIGRWWGSSPITHRQEEIDLIAQDGDRYLFCECKWRNEEMETEVLDRLCMKANIFRKNRGESWFALFSKGGFSDGLKKLVQERKDILLVGIEELCDESTNY